MSSLASWAASTIPWPSSTPRICCGAPGRADPFHGKPYHRHTCIGERRAAVLPGAFSVLFRPVSAGWPYRYDRRPVARKTHTATAFGAKLDTAADILFAAVCLVKLLPVLNIPLWMFIWIGLIALIKIMNIVSGFVIRKRFVSVHTPMNKATGALLFLLPLTVSCIDLRYTAPIVCAVATFAALQEGHLIRTGRSE